MDFMSIMNSFYNNISPKACKARLKGDRLCSFFYKTLYKGKRIDKINRGKQLLFFVDKSFSLCKMPN